MSGALGVMRSTRWMVAVVVLVVGPLGAGCEPEGAPGARKALLEQHVPRVKEILREDREKHWEAIQEAASRLAPGFGVEDADSREAQMRVALRRVQELPRGIAGLVVSPISFLAVADARGVVIARDLDDGDDTMQGQDFAERFAPVAAALESGTPQMGLVSFENEGDDPSVNRSSWLFAAPARRGGEVVGAVVAGIPLWREAQRLSRQLRVELAPQIEGGLIIWTLMLDGEQLIVPPGAPTEVTSELPDGAALRRRLEGSDGGFTSEMQAFGKWYGYAVVPAPTVGEGVALVVLRAGEGEPE